jgi:hypothetical protein
LPLRPDGCTLAALNFHNKDWCLDGVALSFGQLQFFSTSCLIKDSIRTM